MATNTDRAPSKRAAAAAAITPAVTVPTQPDMPLHSFIFNLAVVVGGGLICETFVLLVGVQMIVGTLCKAFSYWVAMNSPGV